MTIMTQYPNWFNVTGLANFEKHLLPLAGAPEFRCLQIGVFTGDASVWLCENVLTGPPVGEQFSVRSMPYLEDVDTWQGSDEEGHAAFDWTDVERVYDERTNLFQNYSRLYKRKQTSAEFFAEAGDLTEFYDFIYIDGAHDSYSVMNDAVGAFRLLKVGALIAFDDYTWTNVARAVDAFDELWGDRLELVESNAQAWFRRVR